MDGIICVEIRGLGQSESDGGEIIPGSGGRSGSGDLSPESMRDMREGRTGTVEGTSLTRGEQVKVRQMTYRECQEMIHVTNWAND